MRLAAHSLSQELRRSFDDAEVSLERALADIRDRLAGLDKTLMDSAVHAGEKMKYQLTQLRARAARAELRQTQVLSRHADFLSNTLYPNKILQEREVAGPVLSWGRIGGRQQKVRNRFQETRRQTMSASIGIIGKPLGVVKVKRTAVLGYVAKMRNFAPKPAFFFKNAPIEVFVPAAEAGGVFSSEGVEPCACRLHPTLWES